LAGIIQASSIDNIAVPKLLHYQFGLTRSIAASAVKINLLFLVGN
jgi:hypothetical protein